MFCYSQKTLRKYQFHTLPMWDLQYKHKYLNYQYLHVGQFVFINFQATLFKSNEFYTKCLEKKWKCIIY